jgi:hypothetical protein
MQQQFTLDELTPEALLELAQEAGHDARIDDEHVVLLRPGIILLQPCPDQRVLRFVAPFWLEGRQLAILKFCNRINRVSVMTRASVDEKRDAGHEWYLCVDREIPLHEGQVIARHTLLSLLAGFVEFVDVDIRRFDTDGLLD